jgi:hypothetical protein
MNPIAGMGGMPKWGMPMTATPIGLPGPAHLPLGGPASLRSHTIVNNTKVDIGKPVKRMLIEVDHSPGYRMPKPVNYIRYSEKHPTYGPGELAQPRFARP